MALRELAGDSVRITLLAPERHFHYRPMAVAEPFTIAHARRIELAKIAAEFDADLLTGALDGRRGRGAPHRDPRRHADRL